MAGTLQLPRKVSTQALKKNKCDLTKHWGDELANEKYLGHKDLDVKNDKNLVQTHKKPHQKIKVNEKKTQKTTKLIQFDNKSIKKLIKPRKII